MIDISPDQQLTEKIKRTVINRKTREIIISPIISTEKRLTVREREILLLIHHGFLSKELWNNLLITVTSPCYQLTDLIYAIVQIPHSFLHFPKKQRGIFLFPK